MTELKGTEYKYYIQNKLGFYFILLSARWKLPKTEIEAFTRIYTMSIFSKDLVTEACRFFYEESKTKMLGHFKISETATWINCDG
jgi:hypothetical protein